jgi:hypothetical protein
MSYIKGNPEDYRKADAVRQKFDKALEDVLNVLDEIRYRCPEEYYTNAVTKFRTAARSVPLVLGRLEPCPLCGSEVKSFGIGDLLGQPLAWQAGCEHCGTAQTVTIYSEPFRKATDEAVAEARIKAEEKWNNLARGKGASIP